MNTESETIKPKNDLQLVASYSNHCLWKHLKNDSGAGANAASRVNLTLSATDPLSEIVWSPDRGLCLSCVDSSFADKNTSPYQDVGPSSMVLALLQSVTSGGSNTEMPKDDVFVNPLTVICAKSGVSSADTPSRHPSDHQSGVIIPDCEAHKEHVTGCGGNMEKINAARGGPNLPNDLKENLVNYCENNISDQANIGNAIISDKKENKSSTISGQIEQRPVDNFSLQGDGPKHSMQPTSLRKISNGGMDFGSGDQGVVTEDGLCAKVEHITEYEGSGALTSSSRSPLLEKLESTAENDLQTFNCEAPCAATRTALVSKSNEDRNKTLVNRMMQPCNSNLPGLHSPCNSRIHTAIGEGNEKSLSDGNANASLSKEENGNHSSVESCYSAGLFLKDKKRCNSQQQLIIGSKRIKRQIQETLDKSEVQRDSSFMNLVSNMMKGFSQSTQDEAKSFALTAANRDRHLPWHDQNLISCNENRDSEPKITGFNYDFKSMSYPSLKNVEPTIKYQQVGEASRDFEPGNKVNGMDVTPITCFAENNSFHRQYLQSNKFELSTDPCDAGLFLQPKIRPINFFNSHENRKNNSGENDDCLHSRLSKEKEGMTLQSSPTRQDKTNNVEYYVLSKRKVTNKIFHKCDTPGDLWMTRFLPKPTSSLITVDHLNEIGGSQVHSPDRSTLPHSHKHFSYLNNCKFEGSKEQCSDDQLFGEAKKPQNCCIHKEDSDGLKDRFIPITPFPGFSDSEPMASMFARRLGAIKHLPTSSTDSISNRKASSSGGAPPHKLVVRFEFKKV